MIFIIFNDVVCCSKMIQSENIPGVYVIPSHKSSFGKGPSALSVGMKYLYSILSQFPVWSGVIFVRTGLYRDGIFRFSIALPDKFPSDTEVPVTYCAVLLL